MIEIYWYVTCYYQAFGLGALCMFGLMKWMGQSRSNAMSEADLL